MTHDPNYLKYIVKMQVYKNVFYLLGQCYCGTWKWPIIEIFNLPRLLHKREAENDTKFVTKVEIH